MKHRLPQSVQSFLAAISSTQPMRFHNESRYDHFYNQLYALSTSHGNPVLRLEEK